MDNLADMVWIEMRKATRSRMPWLSAVIFLLLPLGLAFMMFIYKDPELARNLGILSAKANIAAVTADWPAYENMQAQAIALAGLVLFSLVASWVFGREFADGTVKDLLAVPVARHSILLAKFLVVAVWSLALTALMHVFSLGLGALLGLAQGTPAILAHGAIVLAITTVMSILVITPVALFASMGRGYLVPMGAVFILLLVANVLAVAGWGSYIPWSVPSLYARAGESAALALEPASYWIVGLTGLAGVWATPRVVGPGGPGPITTFSPRPGRGEGRVREKCLTTPAPLKNAGPAALS